MFISDVVSEIMHEHVPEGFALREPTAKKVFRVPKVPIGIHERWAGDGHDKLYKIGFPIWAVVDDATGKWLGAWVVPSNRIGEIVAYLFLCLVEKYEGAYSLVSEKMSFNSLQASRCSLALIVVQRRQNSMVL